jgi:RimJ/RimL family protein N-acetyltransferase
MIENVAMDQHGPQLVTERLVLRRWTDDDRGPFAALNADTEVMRYFRSPLERATGDAFINRIESGFDTSGYGLWAVQLGYWDVDCAYGLVNAITSAQQTYNNCATL